MQLGIVADEIDRDFAKAVRLGCQLGIRRYEVRYLNSGRAPMCDRSEMLAVERCAAEQDIQITALSPGLFKYTDNAADFDRELNDIYPRAAEWAKRWNLSGLIIFGFRKPGATEENGDLISSSEMPGQIVEWMSRAAERAASDGLHLLIEPEPICWADTWSATLTLLKTAGNKALKINYDPGNVAWVQRKDTLAEFDQLAPYISNVHVKDLAASPRGSGRPRFVIPGEGMINYRAHFTALKQAGYCGPISLEPHMSGDLETISRCKAACERIWGLSNGALKPAR